MGRLALDHRPLKKEVRWTGLADLVKKESPPFGNVGGKNKEKTKKSAIFHVGANFILSEDSSNKGYSERAPTIKSLGNLLRLYLIILL